VPLVALAVTVGAAATAGAQEPGARAPGLDLPVREDTLENGMRVLALHRPGAPTASFVLRFDVGSVNESLGQTGVAHFLEHLLFKGTTTIGTTSLEDELELFRLMDAAQDSLVAVRAGQLDERARVRLRRRIEELEDSAQTFVLPNEFDRILTENGARDVNATTSYEGTTYYSRLPSNRAELWFVMEADRMANPVFRDFYTERDVVAEERRTRVESSPGGRLTEEFHAAAYRVHPYGVPVIGHMSDIQTATRAEVAAYHRRYYRPNNAVLAVVGDIDPAQIVEWARKYFGPIPPGATPPPVLAAEPSQRGERRVRVVFEAEPELLVGWHVPPGDHEDAPALTVLSRVLSAGKTGRLYRRVVVDDQLATSVSATLGPGYRGPRLFSVGLQPLAGRETADLESALYEEIERLAREPPTDREIQRVRNQIEASDIRRLASNIGLAFQLAESVAIHDDWRETFRAGADLAAVTPEDVSRVARTYLTEENRTVAVLERPSTTTAAGGSP
jgi:predicted Zn-dependent peptidase